LEDVGDIATTWSLKELDILPVLRPEDGGLLFRGVDLGRDSGDGLEGAGGRHFGRWGDGHLSGSGGVGGGRAAQRHRVGRRLEHHCLLRLEQDLENCKKN